MTVPFRPRLGQKVQRLVWGDLWIGLYDLPFLREAMERRRSRLHEITQAELAARQKRIAAQRIAAARPNDGPTPERIQRLGRDPIMELFRRGRLSSAELAAAREIRDVVSYLMAGQFARPASAECKADSAGGGGDPYMSGVRAMDRPLWFSVAHDRYRQWLSRIIVESDQRRAGRPGTLDSMTVYVVTAVVLGECRCAELDQEFERRKGWAATIVAEALALYPAPSRKIESVA